ncbi:MAG: hypothetical protein ACR2NZ_01540, partial [Rubripirellula sp.]
MQGLELTYAVLGRTRNEAAVDVLLSALSGAAGRELALKTLLERSETRTPAKLLSIWSMLGEEDFEILRKRKSWFSDAISAALDRTGEDAITAIAATESLQLTTFLPRLVDLAESGRDDMIRRQATQAVVALSSQLGRDARADRDLPTIRCPALSRLQDSISNFETHGNEVLVDAFLMLSTWGDSDLRRILQARGKLFRMICARFAESEHDDVLTLLAGFLGRRSLHESLADLMRNRDDKVFRDIFLTSIGTEPTATTLKNLMVVGMPQCCRGGQEIVDELNDERLTALVQLYASANPNHTETLHLIASTAERENAICHSSAALALSRCEIPSDECLLRAALHVADQESTLAMDEDARLLKRLIDLLEHSDEHVVHGVRRVLESLHAPAMMAKFETLRRRSRRLLGRVVMMIDSDAIQRISDGLRHPVLSHRLDAIAMADALALVDLLSESFSHISQEDHQEARMRAADAMSNASGEVTMALLKDMTELPECPVRD